MARSAETKERPKLTRGFILDNGKFVTAKQYRGQIDAAIKKAVGTKAEDTQELRDQTSRGSKAGINFEKPAHDLEQLAGLLEQSTPHYRAVKAKADDSVGRGWELVKTEESAKDSDFDRIMVLLNNPSARQSLDEVLHCAVMDFESVGNLGIEMVREEDGTPAQLNHIPAKTLRVKSDFTVFGHFVDIRKTFFKSFGTEGEYDKETGLRDDNLAKPQQANELLYRRKYHPKSDIYGLPDVIPSIGAIVLALQSRGYNLDFFENGGIPAYVVIIEGGDVDEDLEKFIEDFFTYELKGDGNHQRTMIIPVPHEGVKVKIEKISPDMKEGSFKELNRENRNEVLQANGVPASRAFQTESSGLGRDQSREMNKVYIDSTVEPIQKLIERMMTMDVIQSAFEISGWAFSLNRMKLDDRVVVTEIASKGFTSKTISKNERRRLMSPMFANGLEDVEGGDEIPSDEREGGMLSIGGKSKNFTNLSIDYTDNPNPCWEKEVSDLELKSLGTKQASAVRTSQSRMRGIIVDAQKSVLVALDEQARLVKVNFNREAGGSFLKRMFSKQTPINITGVLKDVDGTTETLELAIKDIKTEGVATGARTAFKDVGIDLVFNLKQPRVIQFIEQDATALSASITKTTSTRIRNTLLKGIGKGETNAKLGERIERVFNVNAKRALLIARTETARAFNMGTVFAYKESGKVDSIEVIDVGTLPEDPGCVFADGQIWNFETAQSNTLEHPNCVRTFVPVVS